MTNEAYNYSAEELEMQGSFVSGDELLDGETDEELEEDAAPEFEGDAYEAIQVAAKSIIDGRDSKEDQINHLKGIKDKINKSPEVLLTIKYDEAGESSRASETIFTLVDDIIAKTSDNQTSMQKEDLTLLKESTDLLNIIVKKGSDEEEEYAVGLAFDMLFDRPTVMQSKAHQVALMKVLNSAMSRNPKNAKEFTDRIIFTAKTNLIKTSHDCDDYHKDMVNQSVELIEKLAKYGAKHKDNEISKLVITTLTDTLTSLNPDMSNAKRRMAFKEVDQALINAVYDSSSEVIEYSIDEIFDAIQKCPSKAQAVELMSSLDSALAHSKELSEETAEKIAEFAKDNIVKASRDYDYKHKDVVKNSLNLIETISEFKDLPKLAANTLTETIGNVHPDMTNHKRRHVFNSVSKPLIKIIRKNPEICDYGLRVSVKDAFDRLEDNSKSLTKRDNLRTLIQKTNQSVSRAISKANVRNIRKAKI